MEGASGHHWVHATAGRPVGEFIPPFTPMLQSKIEYTPELFKKKKKKLVQLDFCLDFSCWNVCFLIRETDLDH